MLVFPTAVTNQWTKPNFWNAKFASGNSDSQTVSIIFLRERKSNFFLECRLVSIFHYDNFYKQRPKGFFRSGVFFLRKKERKCFSCFHYVVPRRTTVSCNYIWTNDVGQIFAFFVLIKKNSCLFFTPRLMCTR
jgi:hypothetical protein